MGAFDKQPITFTPGKGWFKTLQQFAADSHLKISTVNTDNNGITLVNGWQGSLTINIFVFDNGHQFRLFSGLIHNPNLALENGQIYKVATMSTDAAGYIGYSLVGAGDKNWMSNEHGVINNGVFYIQGGDSAGKDTWFNVNGFVTY